MPDLVQKPSTGTTIGAADGRAIVPADDRGKPIEAGELLTRSITDISRKLRNGAGGAIAAGAASELTGFDRLITWLWNGTAGAWLSLPMPDEIAMLIVAVAGYFVTGWATRDRAPPAVVPATVVQTPTPRAPEANPLAK